MTVTFDIVEKVDKTNIF
jgi:hypothetical protein